MEDIEPEEDNDIISPYFYKHIFNEFLNPEIDNDEALLNILDKLERENDKKLDMWIKIVNKL